MDKKEFYQHLVVYMHDHPQQRKGQAAFNVMWYMFPDIADEFRGSELDPFYHDERTLDFVEACFKKLEE